MWSSILCSIFPLVTSGATPHLAASHHAQRSPVATLKNGSYSGIYNSFYNQDFFLGVPYAQPPINDLRFRVPQPLNTSWEGTKKATAYPPFCIGYGGDDTGHEKSEDCLYVEIVRPHNPSTKLPVAFWIHGGGLYMGGSNDPRYNLSFIVQNSVTMGTPMVGVSVQYRLSAWGFLGGKEALAGGATNLGYRDQRRALEWIQENIGAFGGDPKRVTIWGESAGAESVGAHLLAYNGRDDKLFRAGIAESGGPANIFFPILGGYNSTQPQESYNTLVTSTSCATTLHTQSSLDCLRGLSFPELNAALNITTSGLQPFSQAVDHDFIVDYPSIQLSAGKFVRVPLLIGTNSNEGTAFGSGYGPNGNGANTDQEWLDVLNHTSAITGETAAILSAVYPNIQAVGIPSVASYPEIITPGSTVAESYGLQFRRLGAYFGDMILNSPRRVANIAWSNFGVSSYAYRFDVIVAGTPPIIGATHFQEVVFVFNNTRGEGYTSNPFANKTQAYFDLAVQMSRSWVAFITQLDPNKHGLIGKHIWPVYNATVGGGAGEDFVWTVEQNSYAESDTYRTEGMDFIAKNALSLYGR